MRPGHGHPLAFLSPQASQTEVGQLWLPLFVHYDIGRLDVAMDHPVFVGIGHGATKLPRDRNGPRYVQDTLLLDKLFQIERWIGQFRRPVVSVGGIGARHIFHGDIGPFLVLGHGVNMHDMEVSQGRHRTGLGAETFQEAAVVGELG